MLEMEEKDSLDQKYGRFAQDSWIYYELGLRKMDAIKSNLKGGAILEKLRVLLLERLDILAISKDELT